ncbi:MAG: 3',5'-cyclic-nucleotide phosphodiesterase [candidate division NC10 bacterium]|nr:3',5'-cyclic-nucleotide phosphodiesterase [candidate division NC10 bacterium]
MRYRVLGCFGGEAPRFHLSSFLLDDTLLIDAGSVTAILEIPEQLQIEAVLLTHSHLDHVRGLAHLADNVFGRRDRPILVYSIEPILEGLKSFLLNNVLWPDFTEIPNSDMPILDFRALPEGKATALCNLRVTPFRLSHAVISVGYLLEGDFGSLLHLGDTGPTDAVWRALRDVPNLRAVTIGTTFPNRLQHLADLSGHLTPQGLKLELAKNPVKTTVYVYHMKPHYASEIVKELERLVPECQILEQGKEYLFAPLP